MTLEDVKHGWFLEFGCRLSAAGASSRGQPAAQPRGGGVSNILDCTRTSSSGQCPLGLVGQKTGRPTVGGARGNNRQNHPMLNSGNISMQRMQRVKRQSG